MKNDDSFRFFVLKSCSRGTNCARNILKPIVVYIPFMVKILSLYFTVLVALSAHSSLLAQTPEEFEANYAKRIKMEQINGVYIPVDLNDAFSELTRLSDPKGLEKFKNAPDSAIDSSHFGLMPWIQLNWGLDEGSRFSHYMKSKGISVPDDMARVVVVTFHRHLNGKPLMLEQEVALIQERLAQEQARRDSLKVIISVEKKPHKE